MTRRALFIGRFQPFHDGHIDAIRTMLHAYDQVIIAIGSVQSAFEINDPFTCSERFEMIIRALDAQDLSASVIVTIIPNIDSNAVWVQYFKTLVPDFEVVYSNNPFVITLCEAEGILVKSTVVESARHISGSIIRHKIRIDDTTWKNMVPNEIVEFIELRNCTKRFKLWIQ